MRMLLRYGFVLLLTLTVLPLRALDAPPPRNLIPELNFQNPAGWSLGSEGTIQSVGGKFADQVLEIRRSNGSLYQPVSYQLNRKQLRNNTVYTFGAWVQGTQDSNPSLAIEFHDEAGKYLSGVYLGDHNPSMTEWHLFSGEFITPENAGHAKLTLFLPQNRVGINRFCGMFVAQAERPPELWLYWKSPRGTLFTDAEKTEMTFGIQMLGLPENLTGKTLPLRASIEQSGTEYGSSSGNWRPTAREIAFTLPVHPGYSEVRVEITTPDGRPVAVRKMPLTAAPASEASRPGTVSIDAKGRIRVDGKKFLPIGLYMNSVDDRLKQPRNLEEDLQIIAQSPFNCILDYSAMSWKEPEKIMEFCEANGIKVIAPLGADQNIPLMGRFQNSPPLLAWYIADEPPGSELENILKRKAELLKRDFRHPVLAVFCRDNDVVRFASLCDLYGMDHYSITNPGDTLDGVVSGLENTLRALGTPTLPLVGVPQFHNIGNYATRNPEEYAKYRAPTETEMRASVWLDAISGAKAFLGYSYFDLFSGVNGKAEFDRRWPEVCRVGADLRNLSDYLLGDVPMRKIVFRGDGGILRGGLFSADDGRRCVLIAAPHGPVKGSFTLPVGWKPKSCYGHVRPLGGNRWEFSADGAAAELLID